MTAEQANIKVGDIRTVKANCEIKSNNAIYNQTDVFCEHDALNVCEFRGDTAIVFQMFQQFNAGNRWCIPIYELNQKTWAEKDAPAYFGGDRVRPGD